jgi:hypothetical protein
VKRFAIAALLAVFACAPSVGWAETTSTRSMAAGDTIARRNAAAAPADFSRGETADYAAREAAAPALAEFAGGRGGGIYIGGGALVVILLVIIIVLLL